MLPDDAGSYPASAVARDPRSAEHTTQLLKESAYFNRVCVGFEFERAWALRHRRMKPVAQ
jgi:hypothetical protein